MAGLKNSVILSFVNMKNYELTIISKPDEKTTSALVTKIKDWIEAAKGKVQKIDSWGTKPLAYPINKLSEAAYTLLVFSCDSQNVKSIGNRLRLEPEVVRHLLLVKDQEVVDEK